MPRAVRASSPYDPPVAPGGLIEAINHPARLVVAAFVALIGIGTILLTLPISADGPGTVGFDNALFMATSAATVTGLASVDVGDFSLFGETVIMLLMQIGGFGIMTIGSVLVIVVSNRVGLRQRMLAQAEIGAVDLGDLRQLLVADREDHPHRRRSRRVHPVPAVLAGRVRGRADRVRRTRRCSTRSPRSTTRACRCTPTVSRSSSATRSSCSPSPPASSSAASGFPIIVELRRRRQLRQAAGPNRRPPWSLHARITLLTTAALIVVGVVVRHRLRVGEPGHARPARHLRQVAGRMVPRGDAANRRVQHGQHRWHARVDVAGDHHLDVHRRRAGIDRPVASRSRPSPSSPSSCGPRSAAAPTSTCSGDGSLPTSSARP